jgi:two-component system sensor kinase FixL
MADATGRPREVTVAARPLDGSTVQIDVADTGPGIAPDTLEALFEPFVTTKRGGMGMGLAVSRSIVRAHSGRLWADNNPAGGATFHIVLPTAPPTRAPEPAPV